MLIHESQYKRYANRELDWLGMDSKESFESNYKDDQNRKKLEKFGWIDNSFTYKFNSHGFRCEEFTTSNSIIFLGCSHTVGIGIPQSDTFSNIVSKKLGLTCYNLGQGGSSNDTAFRLARYWVPQIKPKIVILAAPLRERYEIKIRNKFENMLSLIDNECFNLWALEQDNCILNNEKNRLAIAHICAQLSIKFIYFDGLHNFKAKDRARDLAHLGILSNLELSEQILSKI